MARVERVSGVGFLVALVAIGYVSAAGAAVELIGVGSLPGTAVDQTGLSSLLEDGITPHNQAGGFGSAITYSGFGDLYYATPDRGPADGATSYIDRLYTFRIEIDAMAGGGYSVTPSLERTRLLRRGGQDYYTGSAAAFDPTNSTASRRFDPEGVRVGRCGSSVFVSDEYGPFVYEFNVASGKRINTVNVPNKFLTDYPSTTPSNELMSNGSGRQSNRGMEGLAISPDGLKLYGIMQSPLIQDGGLDVSFKRVGKNVRILEVDVSTGELREFLYRLDNKSNGISEITAVNDHEFLVIERDGKVGAEAAVKKIYKIDIADATDIRTTKSLPSTDLPAGVTPVAKQLFIDMLDAQFGLAGAGFPEKIEGLAFGPDLPDGRHLLVVTNDNDFAASQDSKFFAFAIDATDLPEYQPQQIVRGKCGTEDGEGGRGDQDE